MQDVPDSAPDCRREPREGASLRERIVDNRLVNAVDCALKTPETMPAMRRYFVNTVFDSSFVILGVIIGIALSSEPSSRLVVATIITSTVALMISTGISVYEAERLEQSIRIRQIEKVMLCNMEETSIRKDASLATYLIAGTNSLAPLMAATLTIIPFVTLPDAQVVTAAWISISLIILMLFVVGMTMGRMAKKSAGFYGLRMAGAGLIAFAACYLVESLI